MCRWTKERTVTVSAWCESCGEKLLYPEGRFCGYVCKMRYREKKEELYARLDKFTEKYPYKCIEELLSLAVDSYFPSRKELYRNHSTT